jgi:antitoxin ParD1/3/4
MRAIRALQQRRREDALRLQVLKMQIEAGVAALERGDFIELDDTELESYLDGLATGTGDNAP